MMVNGKSSHLDIKGLNYLLFGRADVYFAKARCQ